MVPIVGEGMSGAMVEQIMDAMSKAVDQRSERAKAAYEKIAARGGCQIAWRLESRAASRWCWPRPGASPI